MTERVLITTAEQQTWETNAPVLFLGEWCKLYSDQKKWRELDSVTVPYHWDDREKLYRDWVYLTDYADKLLERIAEVLNKHHGVDYSLRYWRIIVGPWLIYAVQIFFDRWTMIKKALEEYSISKTITLNLDEATIVPQHFQDFQHLCTQDIWNHWVYSTAIKNVNKSPIKAFGFELANFPQSNDGNDRPLQRVRSGIFRNSINAIKYRLTKNNNYFFFSNNFPRKHQVILELSLKQIPSFASVPNIDDFNINKQIRNQLVVLGKKNNEFEQFFEANVFRHIPIYYLEGYKSLASYVEKVLWPTDPKLIITANGATWCDPFKFWAARRVERGAKLVVAQQGGLYGAAKWMSVEHHEITIADKYFSWGPWGNTNRKVVFVPSPKLRELKDKGKFNRSGGGLLVLMGLPRYSYWMYSIPVASQFSGYIDDQIAFLDGLTEGIRQEFIIRLFPVDYGWSIGERLKQKIPDVRFDLGRTPLRNAVSKSRIFVGTYNSTTILEMLSANVPTVMFWNQKKWELRTSAIEYFELLESVGILHAEPNNASLKVNEIWEDTEEWWKSSEIRDVVKEFCSHFATIPQQWRKSWKDNLQDVYRF